MHLEMSWNELKTALPGKENVTVVVHNRITSRSHHVLWQQEELSPGDDVKRDKKPCWLRATELRKIHTFGKPPIG